MQVLSPSVDWSGFLARIPEASSRVLMLDYDGTLAPFQPRPERAVPYPGVRETLAALIAAGGTRIVIISGRPAADVVPLLALNEALDRLSKLDPRKGTVVELRFFGGLSVEETARVLNISPFTVIRDWNFAKAWLHREVRAADK